MAHFDIGYARKLARYADIDGLTIPSCLTSRLESRGYISAAPSGAFSWAGYASHR